MSKTVYLRCVKLGDDPSWFKVGEVYKATETNDLPGREAWNIEVPWKKPPFFVFKKNSMHAEFEEIPEERIERVEEVDLDAFKIYKTKYREEKTMEKPRWFRCTRVSFFGKHGFTVGKLYKLKEERFSPILNQECLLFEESDHGGECEVLKETSQVASFEEVRDLTKANFHDLYVVTELSNCDKLEPHVRDSLTRICNEWSDLVHGDKSQKAESLGWALARANEELEQAKLDNGRLHEELQQVRENQKKFQEECKRLEQLNEKYHGENLQLKDEVRSRGRAMVKEKRENRILREKNRNLFQKIRKAQISLGE